MTGIEKLRKLSEDMLSLGLWVHLTTGTEKDWDCYPGDGRTINNELLSIADQIEQEARAPFSRVRVLAVISDMERHASGVEGAEDSPVARWARELRKALGGDGRDPAADVSMSAYDLLPQEDREAIAWVRYHGGRDEVRMELDNLRGAIKETCARLGVEHTRDLTADAQGIWRAIDRLKSLLGDSVPRAAYERHLARRQRQIDECHEALRRRNQRIAVLASEINRAHNENHMEFLRRAGNYTAFADEVCKRLAPQLRYVEGCTKDVMDAALEALDRRLMPEGYEWPRYEDGSPVRIGDVVSDVEVRSVVFRDGGILLSDCTSVPGWGTWRSYKEPIKRPAVLAADGEPLEVGQTVYGTRDLEPVEIVSLRSKEYDGVRTVKCKDRTGFVFYAPDDLTHQRPVLDADGVPINVGDTVYEVGENYPPFVVGRLPEPGAYRSVRVVYPSGAFTHLDPERLTHTKPEPPDSLELIADEIDRLREEVALHLGDYLYDEDGNDSIQFSMELVAKRCRALAERERGE